MTLMSIEIVSIDIDGKNKAFLMRMIIAKQFLTNNPSRYYSAWISKLIIDACHNNL